MNTSATGGYLQQIDPVPLNDSDLDDLLQDLVVGVTGLSGDLVRPRWQRPVDSPSTPPTQPLPTVDWCSIGVMSFDPHDYPYEYHQGNGEGQTTQVSWERFEVMASFFGPNCQTNASILRNGLYLAQNRESLIPTGIKLTSVGRVTRVPNLINMQWIGHCDIELTFDREVHRTYPILNLKAVQGSISSDSPDPLITDQILVTNPMPV